MIPYSCSRRNAAIALSISGKSRETTAVRCSIVCFPITRTPGISLTPSRNRAVSCSFSLRITSIPVSLGQQVSSATTIATISGDKTLYIEASLPERYIGTAAVGMAADFTSVAYPGETFTAELSFISPNVKTTNRTADIELAITSGAEKLREGMYVTIDLVTEEQHDVIAIPSSAITETLDGNIVYVVEDGRASVRNVTVGSRNDSETVITSGLQPGDVVITAGTVADGSAVNVLE